MKRTFLTIAVCFSVLNLFGQAEKKNWVGVHSALGAGDYYTVRYIDGAGSYDTRYFYSLGYRGILPILLTKRR